jgi:hypothetical protein
MISALVISRFFSRIGNKFFAVATSCSRYGRYALCCHALLVRSFSVTLHLAQARVAAD